MRSGTNEQRGVVEIILTVLLVVAIASLVMASQCNGIGAPGREPEPMEEWDDDDWDDDDDDWDDDDIVDDDDDDDAVDDDDAMPETVVTFTLRIELATPGDDDDSAGDDDDSAADDDDSAADDDDSAADDDDSAADDDDSAQADDDDSASEDAPRGGPISHGIEARFGMQWQSEEESCQVEAEAAGVFVTGLGLAPDQCAACDGWLLFDPASVEMVGGDCDEGGFVELVLEWMLTSREEGGAGDFLDIALLSADGMEELGFDVLIGGGGEVEDLAGLWSASEDLEFAWVGFVDAVQGTVLEVNGASDVLAPIQDGSTRLGWWNLAAPTGSEPVPTVLTGSTTVPLNPWQ
jgi:hypothetical protein